MPPVFACPGGHLYLRREWRRQARAALVQAVQAKKKPSTCSQRLQCLLTGSFSAGGVKRVAYSLYASILQSQLDVFRTYPFIFFLNAHTAITQTTTAYPITQASCGKIEVKSPASAALAASTAWANGSA
jgi:hypothetical protein